MADGAFCHYCKRPHNLCECPEEGELERGIVIGKQGKPKVVISG